MHRMNTKYKILSFVFIFLGISCTSNESTPSTELQDYQEFDVSFDEVLAIREDETNPDSYFGRLSMVKLDSLNNIYILDDRHNAVLKFDKNGAFIKKIGKAGRGPGELERPILMLVDKEITIINEGTKRIDIFDLEGKHRASYKNEKLNLYTHLVKVSNEVFWSINVPSTTHEDSVNILTSFDKQFNLLGESQISPKLFFDEFDRDKSIITTGPVSSVLQTSDNSFIAVFPYLYNGKLLEFEKIDQKWNLKKMIKGKSIDKLYTSVKDEQKADLFSFVYGKQHKYDLHSKSKGLFQLNNNNFVHFLELDVGDSLEYGVELFDSNWNYLGYNKFYRGSFPSSEEDPYEFFNNGGLYLETIDDKDNNDLFYVIGYDKEGLKISVRKLEFSFYE